MSDTTNRTSKAEEVKLHINVVINKEKTKILFAEAGSDFTDVLLSFLLLPLGTVVKVLQKHNGDKVPVIGSLNTLYNGVVNLDGVHFQTEAKQKLLSPTSCYEAESRKLRLNVNYPMPISSNSVKKYEGVFTESAASFIISDDLQVMPNVAGSFMETLSSLGMNKADMDGAETRDVAFGFKEIIGLLSVSMVSRNPVTALLLPSSPMVFESAESEQEIALVSRDPLTALLLPSSPMGFTSAESELEKVTSMNPKKLILKVMIQKSTMKLLLAQADYDFINFLFGLLMVPLGRVEWYLGSNTCLKTMDNLHRSIAEDSAKGKLKSAEAKLLLTMSNYHVVLNEFSCLNFDPAAKNHLVRGVRNYMVRDDLSVAPLGMTSCLSVLNELKVSVSDVEEVELQVGLAEGLSILKAALTSTTALTDGLIKPVLKKQLQMDQQIKVKEIPTKKPKLERI